MTKFEKCSDYEEKSQRKGNVVAFMDEMLEDIQNQVMKAIQAEDVQQKDLYLAAIHTYLSGLQDGNRFARPYPYGENNPPNNREGSRMTVMVFKK